jgi:hypothetical protein
MTKVNLEYSYNKNSFRTNEISISEEGWQIIDWCDKDLADSFIEKMISVFESDRLLRFKNIDNLRFLLKDHVGQFLADKKRKEYAAAGKNIKVDYI